ncbi:MAG: HNH endonuclease [Bacteroidetes bacterium]|nr:MAG: HNH endonuclease [Bacteroidota bacterium]
MNFEKWLVYIGKSVRTAKSYSSAISGSISDWARSAGVIASNLSDIRSVDKFRPIAEKILELPEFQEKNNKGKSMYSAAIKQFAAYLEDISDETLQEDIEEVINSADINKTEKSALISARVGQGKYRSDLIDYWERCALTGFSNVRFLIASHIKPWRKAENQERLDPFNGLLLMPNLDKVFDLGFITFTEKGKIIVSEHLDDAESIGVTRDMSIVLEDRHQAYMKFNRDVMFERNV